MLEMNDQNAGMLSDSAQGFLSRSMQQSPVTKFNTRQLDENGDPIPADQLNLSDTTAMSTKPPNVHITPTYIPGLGILGADIGGYGAGLKFLQDYAIKARESNRADQELGLNKTKVAQAQDYLNIAQAQLGISLNDAAMKTQDNADAINIRNGLADATAQGGYTGGIEYLKTVDPAKALIFQANKLALDDKIMTNQVYQNAAPLNKAKAMFDAYQVGGSIAAGLLNAPPDKREEQYKASLPLLNTLGIDMPKTLNADAQSTLALMLYQGTPQNIAFAGLSDASYSKTESGRLEMADKELAIKGIAATDERRTSLRAQINAIDAKAQGQLLSSANAQASIISKQSAAAEGASKLSLSYSKAIQGASSNFMQNMNNVASLVNLSDIIDENVASGKSTALSRVQLKTAFIKMFQKGALSDNDFKIASTKLGYNQVSNTIYEYLNNGGEKRALNDSEFEQVKQVGKYLAQQTFDTQVALENSWKKSIEAQTFDSSDGKKQLLQWDTIAKPSDAYKNLVSPQDNLQKPDGRAIQALQAEPTPERQAQFKALFGDKALGSALINNKQQPNQQQNQGN